MLLDERLRPWRTVDFTRRVLVLARTVTTLTRCLDILALLHDDPRLQVLFSYDQDHPARLGTGVAEYLAALDAPVISWAQARAHRFDLIIAASENDQLAELDGPILLLPHGIGFQKYYPDTSVIAGMDPARLLHEGNVLPAAIALSHHDQLNQLRASCPQATAAGTVIGDPALDRLLASRRHTGVFRDRLGTGERKLVVLATTWGPDSLLGSWPELPERLLAELPADEYAVAAILHPGIAAAHGGWQLRSWFAGASAAGLLLAGPDEWQAILLAAHCAIVDGGSLALYAAALDIPLLLGAENANTVAGSPMAELAACAPWLRGADPLAGQLGAVVHNHPARAYWPIVKQAAAYAGESAPLLRALLYRLVGLSEPDTPAEFEPVSPVAASPAEPVSYLVGGVPGPEGVAITRFPANTRSSTRPPVDYRHLTAAMDRAGLAALEAASVLYLPVDAAWPDRAHRALREWPHARLVAQRRSDRDCVVYARDGTELVLSAAGSGFDPLVLASLGYVRLAERGAVPPRDELRLAERRIPVSVRPAL
ncbi:hypothetical protein EV191_1011087 [Tamaricihabitans halophyticus]|uniref:CDP-glycerol:poly(Glycerophosphate) glycerophosphotransferase n=1 Tax=Tamaricihabitans halophyticus TaxID=1262583 RepID=A0A4R2RCH9_9PSEU|nr:hypothetical protein [Tamaricihabitans halophyticus]TCP57135.1 hypothetical protein EV191_1011087 [Tamaricihabitans halophyticus]